MMVSIRITFAVVVAVFLFSFQSTKAQEVNALALDNGTVLKRYSSSYGSRSAVKWTALALIDGNEGYGWSSAKNKPFPQSMVFELPTTYQLSRLSFHNKTTGAYTKPGHAAKNVTVSVSNQNANGPFVPILEGEIAVDDNTEVKLNQPSTARWIKLDITANAGEPQYVAMMEFSAFGTPVTQRNYNKAFQGTYKTNWGNFFLNVNGTELRGCYDHDKGVFSGNLVDGVMNITWREGNQVGTAALSLTEDGSTFSGFWNEHGKRKGTWMGNYNADPSAAPKCSTSLVKPAKTSIAYSLDQFGQAALYGIYFDHDSAVLKPQSGPTLSKVLSWMQQNPTARVVFEGHTDSTGNDGYNLNLSAQRASAVQSWLVAQGVPANRISAAGMGETRPVADNQTARGKSLNRRVEVRVQ